MFFSCMRKIPDDNKKELKTLQLSANEICNRLQMLHNRIALLETNMNNRLEQIEQKEINIPTEDIQQLIHDVKIISSRLPNQWVNNVASIATSAGVSIATQQAPIQAILELISTLMPSKKN